MSKKSKSKINGLGLAAKVELAEGGTQQKTSAFDMSVKAQTKAQGTSGTEIYGGYFSEEYLNTLQGPDAAKVWDKMRRSESQVAMLLAAIMNPIKAATWEIDSYENEEEYEVHKDFIKMCLFEGIDFDAFKHEALSLIAFGFSAFEVVHNIVFNHPRFGTFNGIQALAFRSQKTIQTWNLERKTGRTISVEQWTFGDVANIQQRDIIPGEFLLVITNNKEGDNYEGISALRPMYGAFIRKQLYLKLTAIGVEKYAVGTPVGTIPSGKENTQDAEDFKSVLQSYTSHEKAYITKPEGWEIEIQKTEFDADKIVQLLKFENTEMINAVVANFLALGTNRGGGAFALSNDLSDFFSTGIQSYADLVCAALNRKIIPDLIKLNFGQQEGYPKIRVSGISDKAGKELADIIGVLIGNKAITPDTKLEDFLRYQYKLPKQDEATARQVDTAKPSFGSSTPNPILLDEKQSQADFSNQIDKNRAQLKAIMQKGLRSVYGDLKKKLIEDYNSASNVNKIKVGTQLKTPNLTEYQKSLQEFLAKVAVENFKDAISAVPVKSAKLSEYAETIKLATNLPAPKGVGFYDALPPEIKKLVEAQAILLATSQAADLEKIVSFQFTSSATASEDIGVIENDIDEAVSKVLDGSTSSGMSIEAAAGNAVAQVANQARTAYFFDPEVLNEIESFTFENEDPVSEICKSLAGTTFAPNDPKVDEYNPPLHHNCKSRMTPNLKGASGNPEIDSGVTISDAAKKSITL